MKALAGHVKQFTIVYDEKTRNKRSLKTKWLKVVLQVPVKVRRKALSIASELSKHMSKPEPRWLTVIDPQGPEMAVVRRAVAYVIEHDKLVENPVDRERMETALARLRHAARELKVEPVIL